jgi:hypothetical protein
MAVIFPSANQAIPNMGHSAEAIFISPGRKLHDRKVNWQVIIKFYLNTEIF